VLVGYSLASLSSHVALVRSIMKTLLERTEPAISWSIGNQGDRRGPGAKENTGLMKRSSRLCAGPSRISRATPSGKASAGIPWMYQCVWCSSVYDAGWGNWRDPCQQRNAIKKPSTSDNERSTSYLRASWMRSTSSVCALVQRHIAIYADTKKDHRPLVDGFSILWAWFDQARKCCNFSENLLSTRYLLVNPNIILAKIQ